MADEEPIKPRHPIKVHSQSLKKILDAKLDSEIGNQVKDIFLSKFFKDGDWKSMEVRGNGLCLFYSYEAADKEEYECSVDNIVLERFSQMVVDGIENYYRARKQHTDLRIPLPKDLLNDYLPLDFIENNPEHLITFQDPFDFDKFFKEKDHHKQHITEIFKLKEFNTSPQPLSQVLAYTNNRNILQISYRDTGNPQLYFDFFPYYSIIEGASQISNETTILFLKNGHFFPIFHSNKKIQNKTIELFKTITDKYQGHTLFNYDKTQETFNASDNNTLDDDIQKAEDAIAAAVEPEPAAEPPAAAPAAVEPGPAAEELKPAEELEPAPEPAPEKTLVQKLFKKQMIDYFKERKERDRKKGEEGGE